MASCNSIENRKWLFTAEQLNDSPSRRRGTTAEKEQTSRRLAANLLQNMGERLGLQQTSINTALVFMHRFYAFHPVTIFHWKQVAPAALYLAGKVAYQPCPRSHIIKCFADLAGYQRDVAVLKRLDEDLAFHEDFLLQTLGFDTDVEHPNEHIAEASEQFANGKDLVRTADIVAATSLHLTTMCLRYTQTVVACFSFYVALKICDVKVPEEQRFWFQAIDPTVTQDLLDQLTDDFFRAVHDLFPADKTSSADDSGIGSPDSFSGSPSPPPSTDQLAAVADFSYTKLGQFVSMLKTFKYAPVSRRSSHAQKPAKPPQRSTAAPSSTHDRYTYANRRDREDRVAPHAPSHPGNHRKSSSAYGSNRPQQPSTSEPNRSAGPYKAAPSHGSHPKSHRGMVSAYDSHRPQQSSSSNVTKPVELNRGQHKAPPRLQAIKEAYKKCFVPQSSSSAVPSVFGSGSSGRTPANVSDVNNVSWLHTGIPTSGTEVQTRKKPIPRMSSNSKSTQPEGPSSRIQPRPKEIRDAERSSITTKQPKEASGNTLKPFKSIFSPDWEPTEASSSTNVIPIIGSVDAVDLLTFGKPIKRPHSTINVQSLQDDASDPRQSKIRKVDVTQASASTPKGCAPLVPSNTHPSKHDDKSYRSRDERHEVRKSHKEDRGERKHRSKERQRKERTESKKHRSHEKRDKNDKGKRKRSKTDEVRNQKHFTTSKKVGEQLRLNTEKTERNDKTKQKKNMDHKKPPPPQRIDTVQNLFNDFPPELNLSSASEDSLPDVSTKNVGKDNQATEPSHPRPFKSIFNPECEPLEAPGVSDIVPSNGIGQNDGIPSTPGRNLPDFFAEGGSQKYDKSTLFDFDYPKTPDVMGLPPTPGKTLPAVYRESRYSETKERSKDVVREVRKEPKDNKHREERKHRTKDRKSEVLKNVFGNYSTKVTTNTAAEPVRSVKQLTIAPKKDDHQDRSRSEAEEKHRGERKRPRDDRVHEERKKHNPDKHSSTHKTSEAMKHHTKDDEQRRSNPEKVEREDKTKHRDLNGTERKRKPSDESSDRHKKRTTEKGRASESADQHRSSSKNNVGKDSKPTDKKRDERQTLQESTATWLSMPILD
ncbi:uncharacterized protein LOC129761839 [Toxorhynchites rutilus septentrionalis]|uniref:uncharacterized protein LOC129761839 n=1 Tax=Toxorhynchites rutilus septentrionalis TaxID=329112 RepID=UPI00247A45C5|nr:uncharacterized protein LOC129761839 [Toxorhynchites rutilus septentrionalis]XP_055615605.1 uncharacterized protein LOC129761839 [Toxorhynchites rutilus septentrionalis]